MIGAKRHTERVRRKGVALLMAIFALAVISAISVGLMWSGSSELRSASNFRDIAQARTVADSGLQYFVYLMQNCRSDRVQVTELPDMFNVVHDYLAEKLPDHTIVMTGEGGSRTVTVSEITVDDTSGFTLDLSASQVDDDGAPKEMLLVVTGRYDDTRRKVNARFNVEVDAQILNDAIASMIRVIIRGNNTQINGSLKSSWDRVVCNNYPFDIGNTIWSYRDQENIQINALNADGSIAADAGQLKTTLSFEEFRGKKKVKKYGVQTNCARGLRHDNGRHLGQLKCGMPPGQQFHMTHKDFDTTVYKNRIEAAGGLTGTIGDDEKVTLPYPIDNHPLLARKWEDWRFKDPDGNWCYGYCDANKNWVTYNRNPDGKWEFGYYDSDSSWVKVNRLASDPPIGRYSKSGNYIRMGKEWVSMPHPDPDANAKIICEYWANDVAYWRAYYKDYDGSTSSRPKFKNLHIPMGSHAHFKNCTFTGITYVETDEDTDLNHNGEYTKYNKLRKDAPDGSGSGSTNTYSCNNVVFEDCRFEGPIISSVPKDMRYKQNSVMFIGNTVFDSSAIREELQGTTIMMPNYNVNIGDFAETAADCESELVGVLVGGIVDIRDNATVKGTVISMANFDHLGDWSLGGWGSNIGNWEHSGENSDAYTAYMPVTTGDVNTPLDTPLDFTEVPPAAFAPSENITITPDPNNVIPYGMMVRYELTLKPGTFAEGAN